MFNDAALSRDDKQSCGSCHISDYAFLDSRTNTHSLEANLTASVSLGQDGLALGDINTSSQTYSTFVSVLHYDQKEEVFVGGLFLNGHANSLEEQVEGPLLNPRESSAAG